MSSHLPQILAISDWTLSCIYFIILWKDKLNDQTVKQQSRLAYVAEKYGYLVGQHSYTSHSAHTTVAWPNRMHTPVTFFEKLLNSSTSSFFQLSMGFSEALLPMENLTLALEVP